MNLLEVVVGVAIFLIIPIRRSTLRSKGAVADEPPTLTIKGGAFWFARWWPMRATWPFVRLDLYSWGVRIGPNYRWTSLLMPTTEMSWPDISVVQKKLSSLRFTSSVTPKYWVTFSPGTDPQLIGALTENGINIVN